MKNTLQLSVLVVAVCALRFLFDGLSVTIGGHNLTLGHIDALAYGSILTPVLGAHGYIKASLNKGRKRVDNPDV